MSSERGLPLAFLQASTSKRVHTVAAVQASNRLPFLTPHIPLPPTAELALYEADVDYRELAYRKRKEESLDNSFETLILDPLDVLQCLCSLPNDVDTNEVVYLG